MHSPARSLCTELTRSVRQGLGEHLVGLYLHGSAVQNDFQLHVSDLDILGVAEAMPDPQKMARLTEDLVRTAHELPIAGLEFILCSKEIVAAPTAQPSFIHALSAGSRWPTDVEPPGTSSDLLINFALCRQAGINLAGAPADTVFGAVPRMLLVDALLGEMTWHQKALQARDELQTRHQAVLDAARSVYAAETGRIVSKTEGGRWWLTRHPEEDLVVQALALRSGARTAPLDPSRVGAFLKRAVQAIESQRTPPTA